MTDYNVKLTKVRRLRVITGSLLAGVCVFALCEHVAQPASATLAAASAAASHHAPTDYDRGVDNTRSRVIAEQTDSKPKESVGVSIANFAFEPAEITIAPGASVTWTNNDGAPHGLEYHDGAKGTDLLLPGASFSRRFDKPGVYDYNCSVHPYMTGRVVVRAQ
jgi:plastocyanin